WNYANRGVDTLGLARPSEYFRRQVYATFWFEHVNPEHLVAYQDNVMWETDYPHPQGLNPGPASPSRPPREMADESLANVDETVGRKLLFENAARVYRI